MAVGTEFIIDQLRYIVLTESGTTGTVSVGAKDKSITGDIIIPETVSNSGITYTVNTIRAAANQGFYNCSNIISVYIPKSIINITPNIYHIFTGCPNLRYINVDTENPNYLSEDGILYNKSKTHLIKYPASKLDPIYNTPNSLYYFYNNSLASCKAKYINFNNNIDQYFFNNFSLQQAKIYKFICNKKIPFGLGSNIFQFSSPNVKYMDINPRNFSNGNEFTNLSNLRILNIGNGCATGSYSAFTNCLKIETVNVDSQYVVDHFKDFFPQITSSTSPLKYVNIGDSVTSIGNSAFISGSSLREVHLGKNVESIGSYTFNNCTNLHYIYGDISLYRSNVTQIFNNDPLYRLEISKKSIFTNALPLYKNHSNIIIYNHNENYNYIYNRLFDASYYTRKIIINDEYNKIITINSSAFRSCSILKNITLSNLISTVGDTCFSSCPMLDSVIFNGNCPTTSSNNIFSNSNNQNLKVYYYQDTIGWSDTFSEIQTQKVFRGEVTVGNYTYKFIDGINGTPNVSVRATNNVKLSGVLDVPQTVTIDNVTYTVRYVADNGFENQYNITSFDMHNQYLEIGKNAFKGCRNLTTISNTNGITDIGEGAFNGCSNLTSFAIQTISNVYHPIPKNCFKDCKKLQSITLSLYTYDIEESAFENCTSLQSINIPDECNHIYQNAFKNCTSLQTVTYGTNLYIINDKAFANCKNLQSITPSSTNNLETLKDKVFYNCYALTSAPVTSIRDIGKYCFYNCKGLTSLTLPNTTDYVDDCAFGYCSNLSTFTNDDIPDNAEFGNDVFVGTDITL